MTDWSGALARAFHNHLDFSGSSGSSGSGNENSNVVRWLRERTPGTTSGEAVIPVVPPGRGPDPRNHCRNEVVPDRLDGISKIDQGVSGSGTTGTTGTTEFEVIRATENFEERAALVEYGADVPREWAEGFARLTVEPPPDGISIETWSAVVDDAARFLDDWGRKAAALGWSATDVFGLSIQPPRIRSEMAGLLPLVAGGTVVAIARHPRPSARAPVMRWSGYAAHIRVRSRFGSSPGRRLIDETGTQPRAAVDRLDPGSGSFCTLAIPI